MTGRLAIDADTMAAIERHELLCHAIPGREVRDLGDALLLHDAADGDPFWNRLQAVRWPSGAAAFDRRLTEALLLFAGIGRRPHVWPSPVHAAPPDLADRLLRDGFADVGAGQVMVMAHPAAAGPIREGEPARGVELQVVGGARGRAPDGPGGSRVPAASVLEEAGSVLAVAFGAPPERSRDLARELRLALGDPRVVLVLARVDGIAAAAAKATVFGGWAYLSSIGTVPGHRGRGLASLATRQAIAASRALGGGRPYLGVHSGNSGALRLYRRLGFRSVGESPDLLLE